MFPCLFLDRDGVINYDYGYIDSFEKIEIIPGVLECLKELTQKKINIIIITNQSGIARGYFTYLQYNKLCKKLIEYFNVNDIVITSIFTCPNHPEGKIKKYKKKCKYRKPEPGMILDAIQEFNIDTKKSVFIGDKKSDIEAARSAQIKHIYKIGSIIEDYSNSVKSYNDLSSCYLSENKFKDIFKY